MNAKRNFLAVIALLAFFTGVSTISLAGEGKKGHAHIWSYEGETGPNRWGELSPEFTLCSEGKTQSPIDITGGAKGDIKDLVFRYSENPQIEIVNNGHTIQINYGEGSAVTVNGEEYELKQFHFHTPSEHTLKGNYRDMELHLVHKNKEGKLAVVGVFIKKGGNNKALDKFWANMPKEADTKTEVRASFNAAELLPADKGYYRYAGSLTTPPCSESVVWLVLKDPIEVSGAQIEAFRKIFDNNNRPVQPINEREVIIKD